MQPRILTALPVYNERQHVAEVLERVRQFCADILVVDDGSTDGTAEALAKIPGIQVIHHPRNLGYGAGLRSAFDYAQQHGFDILVTIDCDGQHEPHLIPNLAAALTDDVDIVSGSRYLHEHNGDSIPPADRRYINSVITEEVNERLCLNLTDAFCGFKAYRVSTLAKLKITVEGYAMPLQLWVQAVAAGLRIVEFPVPLIYLEEERSFGGSLDNANFRLAHYREVLETELASHASQFAPPPAGDVCRSGSPLK
jgi:dolichol-phosphate mannosyltransferase